MNDFYDHSTYPSLGAPPSSAAMRAELDLIEAGFDKMPTMTGNGDEVIVVNSAGTALTSVAKDASGAIPGLTLFKLNLMNAAGTIKSWFTTAATVARTWTMPDKDMTVAGTNDKLSAFAATTSAELAGVISDETGSGALVFATSPTLVTPTLGVAAATTVNKVTLTAPATGSTLTIANGKTFTANDNVTVGTGGITLGNSGGLSAAASQVLTVSNSITLSGSSSPTLAVTGTSNVSGANTGDQTNITGNAATATNVAVGGITGLGTGVATALAVAVGTAGAPVLNGGALGTPSSGNGSNITNVNAATLGGATFAAPGAIGGGTPAAGSFTTLSVNAVDQAQTNTQLTYGLDFAIDQAGIANKRIDADQTHRQQNGTATFTQSASTDLVRTYASAAVTLAKPFDGVDYQVIAEVVSAKPNSAATESATLACFAGDVVVSNRATNGFTLSITGSAVAATVRWRVVSDSAAKKALGYQTANTSYYYGHAAI